MGWQVGGIEDGAVELREALAAEAVEIAAEAATAKAQREQPDPPPAPDDRAYLARLGLGITRSLTGLDPEATVEEVAMACTAEHGLTLGHDERVGRYVERLCATVPEAVDDLRLALARLRHIPEDPCRAERTLGRVEAVAGGTGAGAGAGG